MRRILTLLLALCGPFAVAQNTSNPLPGQVEITGNIQVSTQYQSYVQLQLINCPTQHPRTIINGAYANTVVQTTSFPFYPDSSGNIAGYVWPNDILSCDGTVGNSAYRVTYIQNGVPTGLTEDFIITSSSSPFNITTSIPVNQLPAPYLPGEDFSFRNLTLSGALVAGSVEAGTFVWQNAPAPCASGFAVGGFNANLLPNCVPVNAIVNAFALNSAGTQNVIQPSGTTAEINGGNIWTSSPSGSTNQPVKTWGLSPAPTSLCAAGASNGNEYLATDTKILYGCINGWQAIGGVVSFNGRGGAVLPAAHDYTFPMIDGTVGAGQLSGVYGISITGNAATATTATSATTASSATTATTASTASTAGSATQLVATPTQCAAGQAATGVDVKGNAHCTAVATGISEDWTEAGCSYTSSSNLGSCTADMALPTAFADTNYTVECVGNVSSATGGYPEIATSVYGKTATGFIIAQTMIMSNGVTVPYTPSLDCHAHHP